MNLLTSVLFLASIFLCSGTSNRAFPPEKVLNLALAASKDVYLPPLTNLGLFGKIKGNWDTMPKLPSVVIGTLSDLLPQPNVFSVLPKQIYNPLFDWETCATPWWLATWSIVKKSKVLLLQNKGQKLAVFGFRGTEAYSLKAMQLDIMANITGELSVHKEYLDLYDDIAPWFEDEYKKIPADWTIVLTGFDNGGAQAYIGALKAALSLERRPDAVITFGSPTVGDLKFYDQYRANVGCKRTISVVTIQDIFSRFPVGAIRPCVDTPVDGGPRPIDPAVEFLKGIFMNAVPEILPQIIQTLVPKTIKEPVNEIFPPEKQEETIQNSMDTIDQLYNHMLDIEYAHNLYQGYQKGIKKLYKGRDINFGCNKNL